MVYQTRKRHKVEAARSTAFKVTLGRHVYIEKEIFRIIRAVFWGSVLRSASMRIHRN